MNKRILTVAFVALATLAFAGCGKSNAKASKNATDAAPNSKIVAIGSTALQPLAEQAAEQYKSSNHGANITIQGGGSGAGLSQVATGAVTIGNSDVFAQQQKGIDAKKLVDHQVAVVGIAPIANKDVGVKNLSRKQLVGIFTGKYKNWQQVGGKNQAIVLINRTQGSGTRTTFEDLALKTSQVKNAQEQDSNGTVYQMVKKTPGAISYIAFSYLKPDVQALSLNGIAPTEKNVTTNNWPVWAYEHMYTKGAPKPAVVKFIKYLQSKHIQQTLIPKMGYIPVTRMQVARTADDKIEEVNQPVSK